MRGSAFALCMLAACADEPNDPTTIHVSPDGDVTTLGGAIERATEDSRVQRIVLEPRVYSVRSGETFPYTVPANVTISGSADGVVLDGGGGDILIFDRGALESIELEKFQLAIRATGELQIDNVRITGEPRLCATGIQLADAAQLRASNLNVSDVGTSVSSSGDSRAAIDHARLVGATNCASRAVLLAGGAKLEVDHTEIAGGGVGIALASPNGVVEVTDSQLHDLTAAAVQGHAAVVEMTRTAIGGASPAAPIPFGIDGFSGRWTLADVDITFCSSFGVQLGFGPPDEPRTGDLELHDSRVLANAVNLNLRNFMANLGTDGTPGNNDFSRSGGAKNLEVGGDPPGFVFAVGNTWIHDAQGADEFGRFAPGTTIDGPADGANVTVASGWRVEL